MAGEVMPKEVTVQMSARGVWYARVYLGTSAGGRQVRRQQSFPEAKSKAEATALAEAWAASLPSGDAAGGLLSVLLSEYIETKAARGAAARSVALYRQYLTNYISPHLGGRFADELTPLDFTRFFTKLKNGGAKSGGPLSESTVNGVYQFLNGAYKHFVSNGICDSNPIASVDKPRVRTHEARALDEWDISALCGYLSAALGGDVSGVPDRERITDSERAQAMGIFIALNTGMRVGEVCALRRRDIARAKGYAHVGGTARATGGGEVMRQERTKSGKGRNVALTADVIRSLDEFMAWQDSKFDWCRPDSPIVSTTGGYMDPRALSGAFKSLVRRLRLEPFAHFHTLRHTHASWCLANGVDIITLSERLGHADPATTARIYGHMVKGRDAAAAEAFGRALDGIASRPDARL